MEPKIVHAILVGQNRKSRDINTVTWRYRTRKSSLVKYPTHPSGRGRKRPLTGPRDVWDISLGMISSFDIAKYRTRLRLVRYFSILGCIFGLYFCLGPHGPRQKYKPKIQPNIDGNGVNITRLSVLTIQYCIVLSSAPKYRTF